MTDVNEEAIKNLGKLARIEIKDDEVPSYLQTMKQLIAYFDQLQEVDITGLSPYSHTPEEGVESLREDVVKKSLSRDTLLANAPDHIGGMIRVPPVFKQ